MELTGEMLKKIYTGPKLIDFGEIFIKSKCEKFFHVFNFIIYIMILLIKILLKFN